MYAWLFMIAAIITEVVGTLAMKHTIHDAPLVGLAIMYLMITLSYGALAIALQKLPLSVAYGAWESVGLICITLASALLFSEPINIIKFLGICLIISGMVLLEKGSYIAKNYRKKKR